MGRRGPVPKPTALKRLQGNPGKRALNDSAPSDATAEWKRVARCIARRVRIWVGGSGGRVCGGGVAAV